MKKKVLFTTLIIVFALIMVFVATGCNKVRTGKDYNLYTYEPLKGDFVMNTDKYVFDKNNYYAYDNTNTVANYGEYETENGVISLIPDKIGTANRLAATTSILFYKEYLIDLTNPAIALRVGQTTYEDRSDLEGIYTLGVKLNSGKVYESIDGSNTPSSFTERIGTYEINKDKDFLTVYEDAGIVNSFLMFTYTDSFGYEVLGLTKNFYSHKKPDFKATSETMVEIKTTIFENKSTDGGTANYDLSLISYPNKKAVSGVTYRIMGANPQAAINGNSLSFTGTGSVRIEYSYSNFKGSAWIYIVDFKIKAGLPDAARTFNVGDIEDYDDIIAAVADYVSYGFTFESIEINNSTKAEAKNGSVEFKEAGTVEAILTIRNVIAYADGTDQVLELKVNIHLIIV